MIEYQYVNISLHYITLCNVDALSVLSGSEVEFTCTRGDSNPEVNLYLRLRKPDGYVRQLGTTNLTTPVFLEDNNANFTCEMTSDAFPTAYRSCSIGPLTVLPINGKAATTPLVVTSSNSFPTISCRSPIR